MVLDSYAIVGRLGASALGELLLARRPTVAGEELVVLRRIAARLAGLPQMREALEDVRRAAGLCHPNIARLVELGEDGGDAILASEHVPGVALLTLMRSDEARLPAALVALIGARVAAALDHARRVAVDEAGRPLQLGHGGLTPRSIRVDPDGVVKVLEFGIAHARPLVLEDLAYLAPEQVQDLPTDERSDIFSLGVVLHELVCCRPLFHREDEEAACAAVLGGPVPLLSAVAGQDVPPALERAVRRALERDPTARQATARELQLELEEVARAAGASEAELGARVRAIGESASVAEVAALATVTAEPVVDAPAHAEPAAPRADAAVDASVSAAPGEEDPRVAGGALLEAEPLPFTDPAPAARWKGWLLLALVLTAAVALIVVVARWLKTTTDPQDGLDRRVAVARTDLGNGGGQATASTDGGRRSVRVRAIRAPRRVRSQCCMVKIVTVPDGAIVQQAGSAIGRTPLALQLQPGETVQLLLAREGWAEKRLTVQGRANETIKVLLSPQR